MTLMTSLMTSLMTFPNPNGIRMACELVRP